MVQRLFNTVAGKSIAILGFAFKADTNDTRESPAIRIAQELLEEGAQLAIHDPKVSMEQISRDLNQQPGTGEASWQLASDPQSACEGADACLLLTEWSQYKQLDWQAIASVMRRPAWLFDARAIANAAAARSAGLQVWRVGEG